MRPAQIALKKRRRILNQKPASEKTDHRRTDPLVMVMASQLGGFILIFGGAMLIEAKTGMSLPLPGKIFAQGGVAALIGEMLGLDRWWFPLQIMLPPVALLGLRLPVPPWIFLVIFFILLLVFWNSRSEKVPLYLSNKKTWASLARLMPEKKAVEFIDLGCGLGGPVAWLAKQRKDSRFTGIESAPLPFAISWLRLKLSGTSNAHIILGDIWKCNLADYDMVYCFLSPSPMRRLYDKAKTEMRPGTIFISNSFEVPDADADELVEVDDRRTTRLHIWRM